MTDYDYDLFTIGAGSGGVRASRMAASYGAKVAVAEEHRVGGTCVIRGCVPKKLMVYASEYGKSFQKAKGYGWEADNVRFDWKTLIANKDEEIDRLNSIYIRNLNNSNVKIFEQRATIKDDHTVELSDGTLISAKHILIATGGTPWVDENVPGHELGITSDQVFYLDQMPKKFVVTGGGYIAIEFACIFKGLGADVTLVYRGKELLRYFDKDIITQMHGELERLGVRVITESVFTKIEGKKDGVKKVSLSNGETLEADEVMWAVGRKPHTIGLGLENANIKAREDGAIIVDEYSKTSASNIYAVGDVTDRVNLTPVAIREGAAFAETVFNNNPQAMDYNDIPKAVFSQPPVGTVGMSEKEAREQFANVDIYKSDFRPMKNILAKSEHRMLMKLVVDGDTDRVVGCHIVGDDSPEMIQIAAIAVKAGLTKAQFDATCALHPSAAEELVTMKTKFTG